MMTIAKILTIKDVVVAKNLRFRCTPNSRMLSENIILWGNAAPKTSSLRGKTAAAGRTSLTSGSWISIVLIAPSHLHPAATALKPPRQGDAAFDGHIPALSTDIFGE